MKVLLLDSNLEGIFWEHVNRDFPSYFFFIVDLKHDRSSTKIWLSLKKQNKINGLMLVYGNRIVQLRGNIDAVKLLLDKLDIDKAEIQGPIGLRDLILNRFRKVEFAFEITLMTLRKGEENLQISQSLISPAVEDAEDIATLMRNGDPRWWGEVTAEQITRQLKSKLHLGVKVDGKLVSVGATTIDAVGGIIAPVVTHGQYRNMGYATSIVSALVEQILQKTNLALIYVERGNKPAMRVYTKVGFKPYSEYFVTRVTR